MRLYADENFPLPVVAELRRLGHDVLTAFEDGRAHQAIPDEKVLRRSTTLERALLTMNRIDFLRLHNANQQHAGIILCTLDTNFTQQADRIHQSVIRLREMSEKLIRINRPG